MARDGARQQLASCTPAPLFQPGGADGAGGGPAAIEDAAGNASHALGILFVIDRIAASPGLRQLAHQARQIGDGMGGSHGEAAPAQDRLGFLGRQLGQQGLADRRAMGKFPAAEGGIETHRAWRIDPADDDGIAVVENGNPRGEAQLGGQFAQDGKGGIDQRDIGDREIAQAGEAEAEAVTPAAAAAEIGHETMGQQGLQDGVSGGLGKRLRAREVGEPRSLAAPLADHLQQVEGASQTLHPIAFVARRPVCPLVWHIPRPRLPPRVDLP